MPHLPGLRRITILGTLVLATACGGGGGTEQLCREAQDAYNKAGSACSDAWTDSDWGCAAYATISCPELDAYFECYATWECDEETGTFTGEACSYSGCPGGGAVWDNTNVDDAPSTPDGRGDHVDSESTREAAYTGDEVDLTEQKGVAKNQVHSSVVDEKFNVDGAECGTPTEGSTRSSHFVVCPANVQPMPADDIIIVEQTLASDVPHAETERSYIYSAVFDSDDDPSNDWEYNPPYDFDYFQGADRWYQMIWDHQSSTWSMSVTQVAEGNALSDVQSTARAVVLGDRIRWYISGAEFSSSRPRYRVSAFAHDGNFGASTRGGDVSGADPMVPLQPVLPMP